jgi:hypothetical protein
VEVGGNSYGFLVDEKETSEMAPNLENILAVFYASLCVS